MPPKPLMGLARGPNLDSTKGKGAAATTSTPRKPSTASAQSLLSSIHAPSPHQQGDVAMGDQQQQAEEMAAHEAAQTAEANLRNEEAFLATAGASAFRSNLVTPEPPPPAPAQDDNRFETFEEYLPMIDCMSIFDNIPTHRTLAADLEANTVRFTCDTQLPTDAATTIITAVMNDLSHIDTGTNSFVTADGTLDPPAVVIKRKGLKQLVDFKCTTAQQALILSTCKDSINPDPGNRKTHRLKYHSMGSCSYPLWYTIVMTLLTPKAREGAGSSTPLPPPGPVADTLFLQMARILAEVLNAEVKGA